MDYGHGGVCISNISIYYLRIMQERVLRTIESEQHPSSVDMVYANHPHTTTNAHPG